MSAGEMAAIIAVFELPPKFSRNNHVNTESRYGIKSAFFDFLFFVAYQIKQGVISRLINCSLYTYYTCIREQIPTYRLFLVPIKTDVDGTRNKNRKIK